MKVKVIWNQWHLKTIKWAISDSLWICESNRRSICNFTRPWIYLPLPICINCRALAWEGVYVYKLAFFFWLSPRTYHFHFEKRLIIDLRYFWGNIALSLILERSPDYPLIGYGKTFYFVLPTLILSDKALLSDACHFSFDNIDRRSNRKSAKDEFYVY